MIGKMLSLNRLMQKMQSSLFTITEGTIEGGVQKVNYFQILQKPKKYCKST